MPSERLSQFLPCVLVMCACVCVCVGSGPYRPQGVRLIQSGPSKGKWEVRHRFYAPAGAPHTCT